MSFCVLKTTFQTIMKFEVTDMNWLTDFRKNLSDNNERIRKRKTYGHFAKKIVKKAVKEKNDSLLEQIRKEYIKQTVDDLYDENSDPQLRECIKFVKKHGPAMFCYPEAEEKHYSLDDICYDENIGLFYAFWRGKKMYFKRSYTDKKTVLNYINNSYWEQSAKSPHRYLAENFNVENGDVILDIGAAEGNFTLEVIDKLQKAYLFECDPEWIEALNYTFADYKDRICIVPKYVSDKSSEHKITIDDFCKEKGIEKLGMIKMDIEGAEICALKGAREMLRSGYIKKCAVCVYHNVNDAKKIEKLLPNYTKAYVDGYIMSAIWRLHDLKYPYWVKGVLRAELINS